MNLHFGDDDDRRDRREEYIFKTPDVNLHIGDDDDRRDRREKYFTKNLM